MIAIGGMTTPASAAPDTQAYWLQFGRSVRLCPGAREPEPIKIVGEAWGVLASGVLLCQDEGATYRFSLDYLNVSMDPPRRGELKRDVAAFDWIGLSFYRGGSGTGVTWLHDVAQPVRGELRQDATSRTVFGRLAFEVPKQAAAQASNMLLYLTFGTPMVALHVL